MSYIINLTSGNVFATIQDGTTNTTTGLTLIGRNYISYGDAQNENFVKLLENFADSVPPTQSQLALTPLMGTLWYDSTGKRLRVYDGLNWSTVSERIVANTAPTTSMFTIKAGDQWWDTVNYQLNTWTGSTWQLVGPAYTASEGKSGAIVETLTDNLGGTHTVVSDYTNGNLISITSHDSFTLASQYNGFAVIADGINVANNIVISDNLSVVGTTTLTGDTTITGKVTLSPSNSGSAIVPGVDAAYSIGSTTQTFKDIFLDGNIVLGYANVHFTSNNNLVFHNYAYQGNINAYVNSTLGNINAMHVDGSSGLISVFADPQQPSQVSTKNYTDNSIATLNATVTNATTLINANVSALTSNVNVNLSIIYSNIAGLTLGLATETTNRNTAINSATAIKANIASPALTGTPTAPTPAFGDATTKLATTAFVAAAISSGAFNYTVSTLPPSGGNNGDFWFQVG
jgi:hypothetical protein